MKRRLKNKMQRARSRRSSSRFTFAPLEPKKLLAGDLAAGLVFDPAADFESERPIEVEATQEVAEEICVEENSKTKNETNCTQEPVETRTLAIGSFLRVPKSGPISFRNTDVPTDVDSNSNFNFNDNDSDGDNGAAEIISMPIVGPTPETSPVETLPLNEPENGGYFTPEDLLEESLQEQAEDSATDSSSRSSQSSESSQFSRSSQIGSLGSQQTFALISPSEATPESFGVLAQSAPIATAVSGTVTYSLQQTDFAFSQHRDIEPASQDLRQSNSIGQPDTSLNFFSDRVREFNNSVRQTKHTPLVFETPAKEKIQFAPSFPLFYSIDTPRVAPRISETQLKPSLKPAETEKESAMDDKLGRRVQIIESAILLIGLPSSRICRGDDTPDSKTQIL